MSWDGYGSIGYGVANDGFYNGGAIAPYGGGFGGCGFGGGFGGCGFGGGFGGCGGYGTTLIQRQLFLVENVLQSTGQYLNGICGGFCPSYGCAPCGPSPCAPCSSEKKCEEKQEYDPCNPFCQPCHKPKCYDPCDDVESCAWEKYADVYQSVYGKDKTCRSGNRAY